MSAARICVGAFAGAFGVKGEIRLKSFCARPEVIADYNPLWSRDGARQFTIALNRSIGNGFSANIPGIGTREQADALRGIRLYVDRSRLPVPEDDEYYHADLIGLTVLGTGGAEFGKIRSVLNHGAGDLLEIAGPAFKEPLLLPFTRDSVPTVDLVSGRVIVDPPDGLFPDVKAG